MYLLVSQKLKIYTPFDLIFCNICFLLWIIISSKCFEALSLHFSSKETPADRSVSVQTLNHKRVGMASWLESTSDACQNWKYTSIHPFILSFDRPSISRMKRTDKWNLGNMSCFFGFGAAIQTRMEKPSTFIRRNAFDWVWRAASKQSRAGNHVEQREAVAFRSHYCHFSLWELVKRKTCQSINLLHLKHTHTKKSVS